MFSFRTPKAAPKSLHVVDDIEQATPPRRGVSRTLSRDESVVHPAHDAARQRRNHLPPLEHHEGSGGSPDHAELAFGGGHGSSSGHQHAHAPAPVSGGLFLTTAHPPPHHGKGSTSTSSKTNTGVMSPTSQQAEAVLLHPILHKIPLQFRFGVVGALSNILFMVAYNLAVFYFEQKFTPSTIYSAVYFVYIPIGHLLVSLLVFGWPDRYLASLASNFPIGLTAMAIGSALTAYCDYRDFDNRVEEYIRDHFTFSHMPSRREEAPSSEFYSSILVLVVTSLWTYVLSVYINAPPAKSDKKEL